MSIFRKSPVLQELKKYDITAERWFILNVLETSVSRGSAWDSCNAKVDKMIAIPCDMWITSDD